MPNCCFYTEVICRAKKQTVSFLENLPFSIIATRVFETGKCGVVKPADPVAKKDKDNNPKGRNIADEIDKYMVKSKPV